jgi:sterol desaturase/sphingolipid hydroxylase (fatty acid hydroxylase superfamily)
MTDKKTNSSTKAAAAYLLPIIVFDVLFPRRVLTTRAIGCFELLGTLCSTILVYDFVFFFVHVALHKLEAFRFIGHSVHHSKTPLSSVQVIRHSFIDGSLQVFANILALKLCRAHPLARALHDIVITYLLTESHAGYDAPWMLHNLMPFSILGGPVCHEEHHRSGRSNYQQFFTYLDYMLDRYRKLPSENA